MPQERFQVYLAIVSFVFFFFSLIILFIELRLKDD